MSITNEIGFMLVSFDIKALHGRPAVGGYLLRFSIGYSSPACDDWKGVFKNTLARVYVGPKKLFLGIAIPEQPIAFGPTANPGERGLLYEILVPVLAFEEVERIRAGNEIRFSVVISGQVVDSENRQHPDSSEVEYLATQSEWIKVLEAIEYRRTILVELPAELENSGAAASALAALTHAKRQLSYGNYDDVVAHCRKAIEVVLPPREELKTLRNKARGAEREQITKRERFILAIDQIANLTHLAHHLDNNGGYVSFSRAEAIFVLGSIAAALSSDAEYRKSLLS